eukprot:3500634-Rhodomonas_salina.3
MDCLVASAICLRVCYAMPGTEFAYGAARGITFAIFLSLTAFTVQPAMLAYALAARSPVLT